MRFIKPVLLSVILLLTAIDGAAFQLDSLITSSDSLIARFSFTGNAVDSSGVGNDAIIYNATLTADRFGNDSSAYFLDGDYDYIEIPHNSAYESEETTINFWFKKTTKTIRYAGFDYYIEGLLFKGYNTGIDERSYSFSLAQEEEPFDLNIKVGTTTADSLVVKREEKKIRANLWYQVTGVISEGRVILYIDGEKVGFSKKVGGLYMDYAPIVLGKESYYSFQKRYFTGVIDDITMYNYALSDSAIAELYHEGGWEGNPAPDTLLAYLPFDGNANDSSGYGHDGIVYGAELSTDRSGEPEKAYAFDGVDDYIKISDSNSLIAKEGVSFSFWAKGVSQDSSFTGIITTPDFQPFGIGIDDGDRMLFSASYDQLPLNLIVEGLTTDEDEWYQYAAVFKGGEYLRLYRNGLEIGTLYGTIPSRMDDFDRDILVGALEKSQGEGKDSLFYKGSIDEVRFYNFALTDQQISGIYEVEKPVISSNELKEEYPNQILLHQNYPNPFNPSTRIMVQLPAKQTVELNVFDMSGRLIQNLASGSLAAGLHTFDFDGSNLASGIYIYQLKTNQSIQTKKLTLIK